MPLAMVREATLEDVPEVLGVINRAYVVEAPFIKGDRATAADIRAAIAAPNSAYLLAVDPPDSGSRIIGALKIDLEANHAHVGPIAVEPSRQGSGVGKALVTEAEKYARARGIPRMDLCVMSFRPTLPRFYESLGFEATGTAPYDDCCGRLLTDAHRILMTKEL
jgi:ribosomal protein S18 acetylase RimI-like enzyme